MDNILSLHRDLINKTYKHGPYNQFKINDPKPRIIHKARVRDRILHHAIYRILYPFFDKMFINDSFSCRVGKGTHKALRRFKKFEWIVSKNNTRNCWVLKCDIKKFFASINQQILVKILEKYIPHRNIINLLEEIIFSFNSGNVYVGLPLGNLTSQLFSNIYMNEFDKFIKHELRIKYYIRYADDFVFFSESKEQLKELIPKINYFLENKLKLQINNDKIFIKTIYSGIDFLGWVNFQDHKTLRTKTKKRIFKRLKNNSNQNIFDSYLGLLKHGNTKKIKNELSHLNKSWDLLY